MTLRRFLYAVPMLALLSTTACGAGLIDLAAPNAPSHGSDDDAAAQAKTEQPWWARPSMNAPNSDPTPTNPVLALFQHVDTAPPSTPTFTGPVPVMTTDGVELAQPMSRARRGMQPVLPLGGHG